MPATTSMASPRVAGADGSGGGQRSDAALVEAWQRGETTASPAEIMGFNGISGETLEQRARELLERVGLGHRLTHRPMELSGGEQQRAALARALMNEPRLLLLDEPGGNLDEARAGDLHRLLLELAREGNVSVVAVTHNLDLARQADRWYRIEEGLLLPGQEG